MKVNTLYFSPTGTTEKIVKTIANYYGHARHNSLTLKKDRDKILEFREEDLLIVGMPVYAGRIPEMMEGQLRNISGNKTPCVLVAVYGNRHYDDAIIEMKDIMIDRGFKPIAAGAFIGEHSYTSKVGESRPDATDLKACLDFAKQINLRKTDVLVVAGNKPYRQRNKGGHLGPTVGERCMKCGICVANCPTEALQLKGRILVDDMKCIRCHACVKKCPIDEIGFENKLDHVIEWLCDKASERREVEFFL